MAGPDFYSVLGLRRGATPGDIRRAYRALARRVHPDVNAAPDAVRRFAELQRAYETLSDPSRRGAYDDSLARELKSAWDRSHRAAESAGPPATEPHFSWANVAAPGGAQAAFEDGVDEMFDSFFGGRKDRG